MASDVLHADVVQDEIFSVIVPFVEVEHAAHVNVASKAPCPFSLAESCWPNEAERFGTVVGLLGVRELEIRHNPNEYSFYHYWRGL